MLLAWLWLVLEHVTANEFDAAVVRLRDGDRLDARATTIGTERLHALLEALKHGSVVSVATFDRATFSGNRRLERGDLQRRRGLCPRVI
ncbi:MAG: hypothetical protein QOD83_4129 [Solirubrobacteraceae bacterium]|jgi:hypothetical protein|nr:hypothetical protein [Solirubrobacteraceae bacterium]